MIADMAIGIEASRLLTWKCANMVDQVRMLSFALALLFIQILGPEKYTLLFDGQSYGC